MPLSLIEQLEKVDPEWRHNVSNNPLEAAVELGLLEPEDLDEAGQPLDFNDA